MDSADTPKNFEQSCDDLHAVSHSPGIRNSSKNLIGNHFFREAIMF